MASSKTRIVNYPTGPNSADLYPLDPDHPEKEYPSNTYWQGRPIPASDKFKLPRYPPEQQGQQNNVTLWLQSQRYADVGEEAYVERRNLDLRKIEISNSGSYPVKVKITTDPNTVLKWPDQVTPATAFPVHFAKDKPRPRGMEYVIPDGDQFPGVSKIIPPGPSVYLGVNPVDGPPQYMHILDPDTEVAIGQPINIRRDVQIFVLREGIQGWFFQCFRSSGYKS